TQICSGKTPSDFKRMIFQAIFSSTIAGGLAPVKIGGAKSAERAPFEASSYRLRLLKKKTASAPQRRRYGHIASVSVSFQRWQKLLR
ncbi:MAG: hypothetical protein K5855_04135, partial [Oscillospiraceae bacterium]|nr:hypothetical protein [Oscillospiraceae bacterium]